MTTTAARTLMPMASPEALGFDSERLERLYRVIEGHIAEGRYPGAQIALARRSQYAAVRSFGQASLGASARPATDDDLFLIFSQTKVLTASAIWLLLERGRLSISDRVADHVPEFARNGKGEITLFQVLTHQGGFPNANIPDESTWGDHAFIREAVCNFTLEWTPGTRIEYHSRPALWTAGVVIEAITGRDYREFIREEILAPVGLERDVFVGVPEAEQGRCADLYVLRNGQLVPRAERNLPAFRAAGVPAIGGYATAAGMAAFYQMLLGGGALGGRRVFAPRTIEFATRNHVGDRPDTNTGMLMHRGLGPHRRGLTSEIRGMGALAGPNSFGHGGRGSSYSFGDPDSGISFSYVANCESDDPWHSNRIEHVSNLATAALVEP